MTKRILTIAVVGALFGASVWSTPTVTHAAVTDAQIQAQGVQTETAIVTTLTDYLHFLQLRYIQQLEARVAQLQIEVAKRP